MCNNLHMATNLALDDELVEEARRTGRHKTKREAVNAALEEYVQRRKQLRLLKAFGTVDSIPSTTTKRSDPGSALTMMVVVDTPIWSLSLRRKAADLNLRESGLTAALRKIIEDGRAQLIGAVRQELLSGLREESSFRKLREQLRAFEQVSLDVADYKKVPLA